MKIILSILSLLIITFLQTSFFPNFEFFHAIPNLILIIAIAWCIVGNFNEAVFWAIAGGLFLDLSSPFYFGIIALSNLAAIMIIYFISQQNFTNNDDKLTIIIIGALSTVVYNFFLITLIYLAKAVKLTDIVQPLSSQLLVSIFIQAMLNIIILIIIYNFVKSIQSFQEYKEQRRQIKA